MICIFTFVRVAAVETDRGLDRWLCFFRRGSSQPVRRHNAHKHSTARPPLRRTAHASVNSADGKLSFCCVYAKIEFSYDIRNAI